MDIKIGSLYRNKTWRFLVPCLRGHGTIFVDKFMPVFKLAVGIHDSYLDGAPLSNGRNIYILLDTKYNSKKYTSFMDWIVCQEYFVGEYCPDSELIDSRKKMVILRIPEEYNNAYDCFLKGEYSYMYSKEQLNLLFNYKDLKKTYSILSKTGEEEFQIFKKEVDEMFGVVSNVNDLRRGEWSLPLKKTEEIFHYKQGETYFFNEKLDKVWQ